jgi:hypothetical protein
MTGLQAVSHTSFEDAAIAGADADCVYQLGLRNPSSKMLSMMIGKEYKPL